MILFVCVCVCWRREEDAGDRAERTLRLGRGSHLDMRSHFEELNVIPTCSLNLGSRLPSAVPGALGKRAPWALCSPFKVRLMKSCGASG